MNLSVTPGGWLSPWAGEAFVYLTTVGRRTGRAHRIEIWFAIHNERLYLMSGGRDRADWVRNLMRNPQPQAYPPAGG